MPGVLKSMSEGDDFFQAACSIFASPPSCCAERIHLLLRADRQPTSVLSLSQIRKKCAYSLTMRQRMNRFIFFYGFSAELFLVQLHARFFFMG